MNIAYFRTSQHDAAGTIARLKQTATDKGFSVIGESALPAGNATVLTICKPEWAQVVVDADPNLMGLLPCAVTVIEKEGKVLVGAGSPTLLGQVARSNEMLALSEEAEASLRALVEAAADVAPLKPKTLKLYSSHTCPYCTMEKNWLEEKAVPFDLIYVDEDQDAAISLVQRTGQRGVPITEVIYDNDEVEFIVGFDRGKLEKVVQEMTAG